MNHPPQQEEEILHYRRILKALYHVSEPGSIVRTAGIPKTILALYTLEVRCNALALYRTSS